MEKTKIEQRIENLRAGEYCSRHNRTAKVTFSVREKNVIHIIYDCCLVYIDPRKRRTTYWINGREERGE